jgi:hypothetical protein
MPGCGGRSGKLNRCLPLSPRNRLNASGRGGIQLSSGGFTLSPLQCFGLICPGDDGFTEFDEDVMNLGGCNYEELPTHIDVVDPRSGQLFPAQVEDDGRTLSDDLDRNWVTGNDPSKA